MRLTRSRIWETQKGNKGMQGSCLKGSHFCCGSAVVTGGGRENTNHVDKTQQFMMFQNWTYSNLHRKISKVASNLANRSKTLARVVDAGKCRGQKLKGQVLGFQFWFWFWIFFKSFGKWLEIKLECKMACTP